MARYDPSQFGAKGDGVTSDTAAIQSAIDAAHSAGGGTVVFAGGKRFISGSLVLKSNVFLHMDQGSLLKASTVSVFNAIGEELCQHIGQQWNEITERWPGDPNITPSDDVQIHTGTFLAAYKGTQNIGITGTGTIDGSGEREHPN